MHKCLHLDEIVNHIVAFLSAGDRDDRVALASLARTCRALQDPALDALWHCQEDLFNILRCLPRDAWTYGEDVLPPGWIAGNITWNFRILRKLVTDDWIRFDFYARRIKRFGTMIRKPKKSPDLSPDGLPYLPPYPRPDGVEPDFRCLKPSVFVALSLRRTPAPFFPSLRHLHWGPVLGDNGHLEYVQFFSSPNLTHLKLAYGFQSWDNSLLSLICSLPKTCPHLQHLELIDESQHMAFALLSIVDELPMLHHFCFTWMYMRDLSELLRGCRNAPKLQSLRISRTDGRSAPDGSRELDRPPPDPVRGIASRIHSIYIDDVLPGNIAQILSMLWPNECHRIQITLLLPTFTFQPSEQATRPELPDALEDILVVLQRYAATATLESVDIQFAIGDVHSGLTHGYPLGTIEFNRYINTTYRYTIQHLQPLLVFHNLVNVDIRVRSALYLDDDCLERMAISWPLIQILNLNDGRHGGEPPQVTLRGILYLARHCQDLVGLSLAINAPNVPQQRKAFPDLASADRRMRWIKLGDSRIGQRQELVEFLVEIFPCLQQISSSVLSDGSWKTTMEAARISLRAQKCYGVRA